MGRAVHGLAAAVNRREADEREPLALPEQVRYIAMTASHETALWERAGQTALQRQVCHQFVRRAEEVQVAPDTSALHEARRVLHAGV
jgi:hypothetical protein